MNNLNVNITPESVLAQKANEAKVPQKHQNTFDVKNYLNARLADGETSKTIIIRLLPISPKGGSPFEKIHMHQVRVNKEVSPSGWKKFPCPTHNKLGDACPFCETSANARQLRFTTDNEVQKKKYGEIESDNKAREYWVTRCIERGHEEDGVKFWLFSHSKKGDGVYDKIMNIFTQRYNKAQEQGRYNNIFDLNEGKDLYLTLTKDSNNKTVINVADDDEKTPLSTDYDTALGWLNDTKKWTDVYTTKPYEYMEIVLCGGVPKFDKELNKYVDKTVKDAKDAKAAQEIEANLPKATVDLSLPPTVDAKDVKDGLVIMTATTAELLENNDDEDLPF